MHLNAARAVILEREMKSVLLTTDYKKVTGLSCATTEKTYVRTKHAHVLNLENLVTWKQKHRELLPEGMNGEMGGQADKSFYVAVSRRCF